MPAGRPTELTPTVLEDVRRLLPVVLYLETVADYIGVDRYTVRRWIKRGAKELKRLRNKRCKPKPSEAIYLEFCAVVKKCLAEGQFYAIGVIRKAGDDQWEMVETVEENDEGTKKIIKRERKLVRKGEWTAAAWLAERRFPEQWGKKDKLDVSGGVIIQTVEGVDEDQVTGKKGSDDHHPLPASGRGPDAVSQPPPGSPD